MDGLLLDTERIGMNCFIEAGRIVGYPVKLAVYHSCIGANRASTKKLMINGHDHDFPFEEIDKIWRDLYAQQILDYPIPIKPGVETLLNEIVTSGSPIALATSTAYELAKFKLRNSGLIDYFDYIVGGDQVVNAKPDPEIYVHAAAKLKVLNSNCIAFEDSENGVRAALSAKINVIQVPDIVQPSADLVAMGHRIIESLSDFSWQSIKQSRGQIT